MDKDKLAKFRKQSVEAKARKHQEILDSNASIKEAVVALHSVINEQQPYDDSKLVSQLQELKESQTFTEDIKRLENALKQSSDKEKLDEILKAVGNINNTDVVNAVNQLVARIEDNKPDQQAESYQPVRRVIKVGQIFVFDDQKTPVASGAGGGSSSSVQQSLTRTTGDGQAIAVANPDGSNIGGGGTPSVPSTIRNGQKTVTTAGTAEAIVGSSTSCEGVVLQALSSNTGLVYVGDSSVSSSNGMELQPGQATGLAIDNLNKVYVDSAENGDGICFMGS